MTDRELLEKLYRSLIRYPNAGDSWKSKALRARDLIAQHLGKKGS